MNLGLFASTTATANQLFDEDEVRILGKIVGVGDDLEKEAARWLSNRCLRALCQEYKFICRVSVVIGSSIFNASRT